MTRSIVCPGCGERRSAFAPKRGPFPTRDSHPRVIGHHYVQGVVCSGTGTVAVAGRRGTFGAPSPHATVREPKRRQR